MKFKLLMVLLFFVAPKVILIAQNPSAIAEKDYVAYLFAYFTGNDVEDESIHYAISGDGYDYLPLLRQYLCRCS